jgi:hypothetical protein
VERSVIGGGGVHAWHGQLVYPWLPWMLLVVGALVLVGALLFHLLTRSDPDPVTERYIASLEAMCVFVGLLTIRASAWRTVKRLPTAHVWVQVGAEHTKHLP